MSLKKSFTNYTLNAMVESLSCHDGVPRLEDYPSLAGLCQDPPAAYRGSPS